MIWLNALQVFRARKSGMAAMSGVQGGGGPVQPEARPFRSRLRAKAKPRKTALVAIARRLLSILSAGVRSD